MRYLGGKFKIAAEIAHHINQNPKDALYLEPFMGSCWVTTEVTIKHRVAGDLHDEIVELYHQLMQGWIPPQCVTREEFEDIRDNRASGKYPKPLVAFAGFGCAYAGSYWRSYAGQQYALGAHRSLLRKKEKLGGTRFFTSDYRNLNPKGCVIYCDPPYGGASYGYRITGTRGNGKFNNDEFWDLMKSWSCQNVVYVSEYQAPEPFELIWEKPIARGVRTEAGNERRLECLFRAGQSDNLVRQDWNGTEILKSLSPQATFIHKWHDDANVSSISPE